MEEGIPDRRHSMGQRPDQTVGSEPGNVHLVCLRWSGPGAKPHGSWGPTLAPGIFLRPWAMSKGLGRDVGKPLGNPALPAWGSTCLIKAAVAAGVKPDGPWQVQGGCSPASPWHHAPARASPGNRTDSAGRTLSGSCAVTRPPGHHRGVTAMAWLNAHHPLPTLVATAKRPATPHAF